MACLATFPQAVLCPDSHTNSPSPAMVMVTSAEITLGDTASLSPAIQLSWNFNPENVFSYFDVYLTLHPDSLPYRIAHRIDPALRSAHVALPNSTAPFTVYYGVKAVLQRATLQIFESDSMPLLPFTLIQSPSLLSPLPGSLDTAQSTHFEILSRSDLGASHRLMLYVQKQNTWTARLDTCLPMDACRQPQFGERILSSDLILERPNGSAQKFHWCIKTQEASTTSLRGLRQGLRCSQFYRSMQIP